MKNQFRLNGLVPYDRSGKVRWLLTELGLEFENHWLDRKSQELDSPEFLRLNPMGRVPVLEFEGRAVWESGAICAYISDLYLDRGMAPKLDSPDRALYQQWMYFASATLDVFQIQMMVIEDIPAGEIHQTKLTALQESLQGAMAALDKTLSKSAFLVGDRFTTADISVGYHLAWLPLWPEQLLRIFPRSSITLTA